MLCELQAAAVRPEELAQLAGSDLQGLWSCLSSLGRLHWPLGGRSVGEECVSKTSLCQPVFTVVKTTTARPCSSRCRTCWDAAPVGPSVLEACRGLSHQDRRRRSRLKDRSSGPPRRRHRKTAPLRPSYSANVQDQSQVTHGH